MRGPTRRPLPLAGAMNLRSDRSRIPRQAARSMPHGQVYTPTRIPMLVASMRRRSDLRTKERSRAVASAVLPDRSLEPAPPPTALPEGMTKPVHAAPDASLEMTSVSAAACFNEAGAHAPRMRTVQSRGHGRCARFNEAGARAPRMRLRRMQARTRERAGFNEAGARAPRMQSPYNPPVGQDKIRMISSG